MYHLLMKVLKVVGENIKAIIKIIYRLYSKFYFYLDINILLINK